MNTSKTVKWTEAAEKNAVSLLEKSGGMIVSPTKVGYIIMVTDMAGLERKFSAKQRKKNKPGVVLCSSLEQLQELAVTTPEILDFYQRHWDDDILLGCILPWQETALARIPDDGSKELIMDRRHTSCFVIKFGKPSEQISEQLWKTQGRISFASSANPSGSGNKGKVAGIGERIAAEADLIIDADDYVQSIQPEASTQTRYEQGVMVSFVDEQGKLVGETSADAGKADDGNYPVVIRKGLDVDKIMHHLSNVFNKWDYRHGSYY